MWFLHGRLLTLTPDIGRHVFVLGNGLQSWWRLDGFTDQRGYLHVSATLVVPCSTRSHDLRSTISEEAAKVYAAEAVLAIETVRPRVHFHSVRPRVLQPSAAVAPVVVLTQAQSTIFARTRRFIRWATYTET